ncbi:MAG TPA: DUF2332 domain-containing protein [Ktedonobacterales bacterium]|nr:DUF2332 domain-containing protein [Ktedonobacterales bacterium]
MAHSQPNIPLDALARRFAHFAEGEAEEFFSPLYARLCRNIAADPEVLALVATAQPDQPTPNLLLAAVQYLLLKGVEHPLAAFYPGIAGSPDKTNDPYPAFHAFCLEHAEALRPLLATRLVQTNEVSRCACLLPAFGVVAQQAKGESLSLIEIGASAGLNLLWDRYSYDYGDGRFYGAVNSPMRLRCALQGTKTPPFLSPLPSIAFRVGLDLNPIDIHNADEVLWLRALIWPEHHERVIRLQQALEIARKKQPLLLAGDALALLPDIIAEVPSDTTLCIFHSFTLNQFSPEQREQLASLLQGVSAQRTIFRISLERLRGDRYPRLEVITYVKGAKTVQSLAYCAPHGSWVEWGVDKVNQATEDQIGGS